MRNELEKFHHTVDVLVKAYLNDTLQHGNCSACAVGNLVADACGYTYSDNKKWELGIHPFWNHVFMTSSHGHQSIYPESYKWIAKQQIDATGYTWQELARIEKAFEAAKRGQTFDGWMFNGLMAVVEVLADIHKIDLSVKENAKLLFVKA